MTRDGARHTQARQVVATLARAAVIAFTVLTAGSPARADEPAPRFTVVLATHGEAGSPEGLAGCLDREAFVAAIRARTPRSQLAAEGDAGTVRLVVDIEVGATRAVGRLEVHAPEGGEERRAVTGRSCREVGHALALVTALVLDPEASTSAEPPLPPEPLPPLDEIPEQVPAPRRRPGPPATAPVARPGSPWLWSAGAQVGAMGGVGPEPAPLGGLFVDAIHTGSRLAPSVRAGVAVAGTSSELRVGSQSYVWGAAIVRGCPLSLALGASLRFGPCALVQVGVHHGGTSGVANGTSATGLWLAPGAVATVEWIVTPRFSMDLEGGALFLLRRSRFFLGENSTIYDMPLAAGTASLTGRVRFE